MHPCRGGLLLRYVLVPPVQVLLIACAMLQCVLIRPVLCETCAGILPSTLPPSTRPEAALALCISPPRRLPSCWSCLACCLALPALPCLAFDNAVSRSSKVQLSSTRKHARAERRGERKVTFCHAQRAAPAVRLVGRRSNAAAAAVGTRRRPTPLWWQGLPSPSPDMPVVGVESSGAG